MRKLITIFATAAVLGLSSLSANAAPENVPAAVASFYDDALAACGANNVDTCGPALSAFADALVTNVADEAAGLALAQQLRDDVRAAGGVLPEIQALFDQLLPGTRSVGGADEVPVTPGAATGGAPQVSPV